MKFSRGVLGIALSAAGIAGVSFALQRRIGLNLGDEGFLWYGARQTARGKVPLVDFPSYDPGRYDWCAAVMRLRRDEGILTLRLACHVVEIAGLAAALAVVGRRQPNPVVRSLWGVIALTWMFPLFRTFETAATTCAVLTLTRLLERPTPRRHFETGVSIGIAAYVGRNHGLYQTFAYLTATAFGLPRPRDKAVGLLAAAGGIVLGYLPVLVKYVTVPRFAATVRDGLVAIGRTGRTNFTVDLPWPLGRGARPATLFDAVDGGLFAALPVAYASVMVVSALRGPWSAQRDPVLFAAACVGLPYLHQAFSRADHYHLASSIQPFLITLAAAPRAVRNRRLGSFLDALSLAVTAAFTAVMATRMTPLLVARSASPPYRDVAVGGDMLALSDDCARLIEAAARIDVLAGAGRRALYVATAPALYAMLDREAPVSEIYWSDATSAGYEDALIADFDANHVEWVVFDDVALDGLDARRVQNLHARFWQHILANFHRVPQPQLPPDTLVLHRDADADPPLSSTVVFDAAGAAEQLITGIFRDGAADGAWASLFVHVKLGVPRGAAALHVELYVPEFTSPEGEPQRLRCNFLDGTCAESGPLPTGLHALAFDLPATARAARNVVVRLEAAWTIVPFQAGINADRRALSVLLVRAELR